MTPEPKPVQLQLMPSGNPNDKIQKLTGKYSRLSRELSLAMRSTHFQTVCAVTAIDTVDHTSEGSESGHYQNHGLTNNTYTFENLHSVTAHTEGVMVQMRLEYHELPITPNYSKGPFQCFEIL